MEERRAPAASQHDSPCTQSDEEPPPVPSVSSVPNVLAQAEIPPPDPQEPVPVPAVLSPPESFIHPQETTVGTRHDLPPSPLVGKPSPGATPDTTDTTDTTDTNPLGIH